MVRGKVAGGAACRSRELAGSLRDPQRSADQASSPATFPSALTVALTAFGIQLGYPAFAGLRNSKMIIRSLLQSETENPYSPTLDSLISLKARSPFAPG